MVDSGTRRTETLFKSTAAFRDALDELEQLKLARAEGKDIKALLQEELRLLREDIALRSEYIESLVDQL